MKTYSFETLDAWKKAKELTVYIYQVTKEFPREENFGMTSQIRRASISVCSNLAEGNSKYSGKEKARYTETSYCSMMELLNQALISFELEYLGGEAVNQIRTKVDELSLILTQLRKKQLEL